MQEQRKLKETFEQERTDAARHRDQMERLATTLLSRLDNLTQPTQSASAPARFTQSHDSGQSQSSPTFTRSTPGGHMSHASSVETSTTALGSAPEHENTSQPPPLPHSASSLHTIHPVDTRESLRENLLAQIKLIDEQQRLLEHRYDKTQPQFQGQTFESRNDKVDPGQTTQFHTPRSNHYRTPNRSIGHDDRNYVSSARHRVHGPLGDQVMSTLPSAP